MAGKNPPEAYRDIIRVWGVLKTYRPPGQTSWSKALVPHEADPRAGLAAVLRVSAEDIRVREGEGRRAGLLTLIGYIHKPSREAAGLLQ